MDCMEVSSASNSKEEEEELPPRMASALRPLSLSLEVDRILVGSKTDLQ